MKFSKQQIKKILCIKPRGIGDIVLSTIILENLRDYFPEASIDYLTEDFAKDALLNNPLVRKIHSMEKSEFSLKVALRLRKEKYDLVFDLWSNPRSAQITFLSGAKFRSGFAYRGRKYAYNLLADSGRGEHHSAEHNLELLKAAEIPVQSKQVHYHLSDEENKAGADFIKENFNDGEFIVGIIPSGGWDSKRCDAPKWVDICLAASEKYKAKFLILWGPGDENDADHINNVLPDKSVIAPLTSLREMSGMINNCSMVIANDSGPMHISAALGVPTLGLFGPTNPKMHGPYSEKSDYVIKDDLFCIICNKQICPYKHECFLELSVEKVMSKIDSIIQRNNLRAELNEED